MAIVGEGFAQAEAAHHGEGKLIDQSGAAGRVLFHKPDDAKVLALRERLRKETR